MALSRPALTALLSVVFVTTLALLSLYIHNIQSLREVHAVESSATCNSVTCDWWTRYGCENTPDSKCLDLGAPSESEGGINISGLLGSAEREGDITYKQLQARKTLTVSFPAFNADSQGFPTTPLMLEVRYKDRIDDSVGVTASAQKDINHRAIISSRINYSSTDPLMTVSDKNTVQVSYLGGANNGEWRTQHYLFDKTAFPLIKAINGTFTISIKMPNVVPADADLTLPIDYIGLRTISTDEASRYKTRLRDMYGFVKAPQIEDAPNPPVTYANQSIVYFLRDPLHPIYAHTKPASHEVNRTVTIESARDEIEPVNLGLYSHNGINNVTVLVGNLRTPSGAVIQRDNITLYSVASDLRRLNSYGNTVNKNYYQHVPDRLEPMPSSLSLTAGTSKNIWMHVKIPADAAGGLYRGSLVIRKNGQAIKSIPISLRVHPLLLERSRAYNPLYHDPYSRVYATNMASVLAFYKQLGSDPYIYVRDSIKITRSALGTYDFDSTLFKERVDTLLRERVLKDRAFVELGAAWINIHKLEYPESDGKNIYAELSDSKFTIPFTKLVDTIQTIARQRNVELVYSVIDEPCGDPRERIIADRLYSLIKKQGYKTTTTYYTSCDNPLAIKTDTFLLPTSLGGSIPPLSGLIDYKAWALRFQNEGFGGDKSTFGYYTTSYSFLRDPTYNRYAHGILAYISDASVVSTYAMGEIILDPFNDFDAEPTHRFPFSYPDFLLAYPTSSGNLMPTINSEGLREGIKDAKYFATLERLINQRPQDPTAKLARQYLDDLKARIDFRTFANEIKTEQTRASGSAAYFRQIVSGNARDYSSFSTIRTKVIEFITQLTISSTTPTPSPSTCFAWGGSDCGWPYFQNVDTTFTP